MVPLVPLSSRTELSMNLVTISFPSVPSKSTLSWDSLESDMCLTCLFDFISIENECFIFLHLELAGTSLSFQQQVMINPDITTCYLICVKTPALLLPFLNYLANILMMVDLDTFPLFQSIQPLKQHEP